MEFKDMIKTRRTDLNMTMEDLAKKVGVSTPTIQRYESGEIKNVRRDKIKLLADALQCTPDYLMGWSDQLIRLNPYNVLLQNQDNVAEGTVAAHKENNENWTDEELKKINDYKQLLLAARKSHK